VRTRVALVVVALARFHHLAAGDLPDLGLSLLGASLGGRLVVASRAPR
jgi:hypothetical protein